MTFDLSSIHTPKGGAVSPYITYGSKQVLKINSIEIKVSQNTKSPKIILHMETRPVEIENFEGIEGAKGQVGKIACGIYLKNDEQKIEVIKKLKMIAVALGLEEEINTVKGRTFEEVISKIESVVCGEKLARYSIFAEEYPKQEGKTGIKLSLPRYAFVESLNVPEEKSTLIEFDKTNPIHYKKLPASGDTNNFHGSTLADEVVDDMPF